ncbi:MAG: nitroreductase family protein [Thermodesulfobacteriota bacterium]|nr:nitroreductase family protein [Thermodesulfobacteriota bacterium]
MEKFGASLGAEGRPKQGEEPTAHILIAQDKEFATPEAVRDAGAAAQTILFGVCAYGLGATWLRSFDRPEVAEILGLPGQYEPDSLISLGVPAEAPVAVPMKEGDIKYWRDESGRHFVPKRAFDKVCFLNGFKKGWA